MARAYSLDPADRHIQLLQAARKVFAQRGYHQTGVAHIIKEAGVARGTFYNYFESKRAVFQAVLEGLMDEVNSGVIAIDVTQPIEPQVRANLVALVDVVMAPDVARLLFAEAVGIDAEGDEAVRAFYGSAVERIERALCLGQTMGVVRDGDMTLTARCLLGLVKEPVFQAALHQDPLDAKALIDELAALLTLGIFVPRSGPV